ncbi:thioredoxin family protein [Pontibacter sp. FD36]|uniref:thioredoxin family protein n=1 Tax=Pontibacter sp. FD36 TaxID=2789860 RepID=UPI0018AB99AC|nr:thioredoxin family protein [Pontibacter sp. FD36]MBF8965520.1 thioredoxin family protein [Pontibacter sp. FD36]
MENTAIDPQIDYKQYLIRGITYEAYLAQLQQTVVNTTNGLKSDSAHAQYFPINLTRMQRIAKTSAFSQELLLTLAGIRNKVYWLVITEYWCGDAAQSLPLLHKVAQASEGKITLRLLYRDKFPALMQSHLTNGGSAIPKLIQLNSDFTYLGEWGPRPKPAQELVKLLKSDPMTAAGYAEQLHRWYAQDKTHTLQQELSELLERANLLV